MDSSVQEIKNKLDIVEVVKSYIALAPAGKNFKACCPFHKEKTPSFMISPDRQTWHCFGACSEGGDIFKFVMKYENLEFYEVLKILAEKAGIELRRLSPADQRQFGVLYDINNSAKDFFIRQLADQKNKEAAEYILSRGLKKEILEEFEIGFAPANFDALTLYLIKQGFNVKDIERAGLNFKTERGGYIDRFRNRIMFPIYNHFGKTAGFSGRILPKFDTGEIGKYVNSPETPIFNKSKILYGFSKSKNFIREEKFAILVEGQMDFLMCWQAGIKSVAAISGTALTNDHLAVLKRLTDKLIFCFDSDEAGLKAAERSIDLAKAADFDAKILVIKDYKDPAEVIKSNPELMKKLIKEAKPAMEFYFERYLSNKIQGSRFKIQDLSEFKNNIKIILVKIKNLASPIERSHWLRELAAKTRIKEEALADEMNNLKVISPATKKEIKSDAGNKKKFSSRIELIADKLIGLMALKEELKKELQKEIEKHFDYFPQNYLILIKSLLTGERLEDKNLIDLFNFISLKSSLEWHNFDEEKTKFEIRELLRHLRLEYLKEKRKELVFLIQEAEKRGDENQATVILKEFDEISKIMIN
ncbi:DNA primase [Candidatus Wolfebacteria bacterium]|nr:DNA primase [Candidatus Wolfebacteria bacterium]